MSATRNFTLQTGLARLVGQPFLFVQPSYGGELTVHLGAEKVVKHPKLSHLREGSYIVRTRASGWSWRGAGGQVVSVASGEPIRSEDMRKLCSLIPTRAGTPVVAAEAGKDFLTDPRAYALRLTFGDGSTFDVFPDPNNRIDPADTDELADWELFTPEVTVLVGPEGKVSLESAEL